MEQSALLRALAAGVNTVPPLTEGFSRAHRYVGLLGALLIGVLGLGINIGTTNGAPISIFGLPLSIAGDRVPYLLAVAIIYFAFRLLSEWQSCSFARRNTSIAKLDLALGLTICLGSVALLVLRDLKVISPQQLFTGPGVIGLGAGALAGVLASRIIQRWLRDRAVWIIAITCVSALVPPLITLFLKHTPRSLIAVQAIAVIYPLACFCSIASCWPAYWFADVEHDDARLEQLAMMVQYRLYYEPEWPDLSKPMAFERGGRISLGANDNETTWKIYEGGLEIMTLDHRLHSRFVFLKKHLRWVHAACTETICRSRQFLDIDTLDAEPLPGGKVVTPVHSKAAQ